MVFKKILFILILPFFLYAQWTDPRPKSIQLWHLNTSFFDSLGNVVRDSVATLSADGITIINDGTFKTKAYASTSELASIAADSANMTIYVGQVGTSGVGGGSFVWKSSGYTANGGTVFAGSSGYWVRKAWIDGMPVSAHWFGAIGDNSTDNSSALQSWFDFAVSSNNVAHLPEGIYRFSTPIRVDIGFNEGLVIKGEGYATRNSQTYSGSILAPEGTGIELINTASNILGIDLRGFSIIKQTRDTTQDTALIIRRCESGTYKDIQIDGFKIAIYDTVSGHGVYENVRSAYNAYFKVQAGHTDAVSLIGCGAEETDSIAYLVKGYSVGSVIVANELSRSGIVYGTQGVDASEITIIGTTCESADSVFFQLDAPGSKVVAINSFFVTENSSHRFMRMEASDQRVYLIESDITTATDYEVYIANAALSKISYQGSKRGSGNRPMRAYDATSGTTFNITGFDNAVLPSSGLIPATASVTGVSDQIQVLHRRAGLDLPSELVFYRKVQDDSYYSQPILQIDNKVGYNTTIDSTTGYSTLLRKRSSRKTLSLAASGNFTRDTLYYDVTASSTHMYDMQVTVDGPSDSLIIGKVHTRNNTTGQVVLSFYHKGVNSINVAYFITALYRNKITDY